MLTRGRLSIMDKNMVNLVKEQPPSYLNVIGSSATKNIKSKANI